MLWNALMSDLESGVGEAGYLNLKYIISSPRKLDFGLMPRNTLFVAISSVS